MYMHLFTYFLLTLRIVDDCLVFGKDRSSRFCVYGAKSAENANLVFASTRQPIS